MAEEELKPTQDYLKERELPMFESPAPSFLDDEEEALPGLAPSFTQQFLAPGEEIVQIVDEDESPISQEPIPFEVPESRMDFTLSATVPVAAMTETVIGRKRTREDDEGDIPMGQPDRDVTDFFESVAKSDDEGCDDDDKDDKDDDSDSSDSSDSDEEIVPHEKRLRPFPKSFHFC